MSSKSVVVVGEGDKNRRERCEAWQDGQGHAHCLKFVALYIEFE